MTNWFLKYQHIISGWLFSVGLGLGAAGVVINKTSGDLATKAIHNMGDILVSVGIPFLGVGISILIAYLIRRMVLKE